MFGAEKKSHARKSFGFPRLCIRQKNWHTLRPSLYLGLSVFVVLMRQNVFRRRKYCENTRSNKRENKDSHEAHETLDPSTVRGLGLSCFHRKTSAMSSPRNSHTSVAHERTYQRHTTYSVSTNKHSNFRSNTTLKRLEFRSLIC